MQRPITRRLGGLRGLLASAVEAADVPGAVLLVADRDEVLFAEAFGQLGIGEDEPMTVDTIFWLASLTKAVTSAAAMQLVERGILQLDAPIGPLLPELRNPRVLIGFASDGSPRLRPAVRPITLRHLLTHTSGFGYDVFNPDLLRARGTDGPARPGERAGLNGPLLFDPGDGWEYGVSTDGAGLAVEAASGQRLDSYFAEQLFGPLSMSDIGFAAPAENQLRLAPMHQRTADGGVAAIPSPVAHAADWEVRLGGAGLLGTADDYGRFMRMILNKGTLDGARVLQPETVSLMTENHVGLIRPGAVASAFPTLSHRFDLFPGMNSQWGLGFLINSKPVPNGRAAGSLSWAGMANCYYWIDPAAGLCATLLAQLLPFGDRKMLRLLQAFEEGVYAAI